MSDLESKYAKKSNRILIIKANQIPTRKPKPSHQLQTIKLLQHKTDQCIDEMKQMNRRQANIIMNALQFIEHPDMERADSGVDQGFTCRVSEGER